MCEPQLQVKGGEWEEEGARRKVEEEVDGRGGGAARREREEGGIPAKHNLLESRIPSNRFDLVIIGCFPFFQT